MCISLARVCVFKLCGFQFGATIAFQFALSSYLVNFNNRDKKSQSPVVDTTNMQN